MSAAIDPEHFSGRIYVQKQTRSVAKVVAFEPVNIVGKKPIAACNLEEFIELMDKRIKVLNFPIKRDVLNMVVDKGMKLIVVSKKNKSMIRRIISKPYGYIDLGVGFDPSAPRVTCEFKEYFISEQKDRIENNGIVIFLNPGDYVIKIGDIMRISNY